MEDARQPDKERINAVDIDYRNVNVAEIMDQVKRIAAEAPVTPERDESPPASTPGAAGGPPEPDPAPPTGRKAKMKAKALRAMVPFFPLIRFLALPLHEEIKAVVKQLDATNRRLDFLDGRLARRLEDLDRSMEYIKLLHNLDHNLVVELTKLKIEEETLKGRLQILEKDLEFLVRREKALEKKVFE